MRNLILVVDVSGSTDVGGRRASGVHTRDLLPDRLTNIVENCYEFVAAFFEQCPLGRLGLVVTREGRAEKLSRLQVGAPNLLHAIDTSIRDTCGSGNGTLQNCLEICLSELKTQPPVSTREVLILWASNSSTDPGDVFKTIDTIREERVICNVVGLGGQVRVLQALAERTGGEYSVPADETHFRKLVMDHAKPPGVDAEQPRAAKPGFVKMGFPQKSASAYVIANNTAQGDCFVCPQCGAATPGLPAMCAICSMTLLSAAHVARSFYSLRPPLQMKPLPTPEATHCVGCSEVLNDKTTGTGSFQCEKCDSPLCEPCSNYVVQKLHLCPGC